MAKALGETVRILLLTQLFHPEPNHIKGIVFAKRLMEYGHQVEVLTGFPNYPGGRVYEGYCVQPHLREIIDGIPVSRVALYPSHDKSGLRRALSYGSFAVSASLLGPWVVRRPDVVHVYQGPATLALPAIFMRAVWHVPFVLDIQDLWPESVSASGMYNLPFGIDLVSAYCRWTYRLASRIVVLSKGYRDVLVSRGVPAAKIEVIYNWCNESAPFLCNTNQTFRVSAGFDGRFTVLFAGTMGTLQAMSAVIKAAKILDRKYPEIRFMFVGGGTDVDSLKAMVASMEVSNVVFKPRQTVREIDMFIAEADALLVHLKNDPIGRVGIPQKTQAYLAAGKPIIIAVNGEASDLVLQAGAGIHCEPENPQSIADAIIQMYRLTTEERIAMGAAGGRFYKKQLCFDVGSRKMERILTAAAWQS